MLKIKNLRAKICDQEIIKNLSLEINKGEIHVIMGPNGSGKSTLSQILAGHEDYKVTDGEIIYNGQSLLGLSPEERAVSGIFLAFQYPIEIPGVSNLYFIRAALNAVRVSKGLKELDAIDFLKIVKEKMKLMEMDQSFMGRSVNDGFSGGEKKRNEILQMSILEPQLAILDEIDSGLDIDALRIVAKGINSMHNSERSILIITHYQRLLDYITPDYIHVMMSGRIVKSGGAELAEMLERTGYTNIERNAGDVCPMKDKYNAK